MVWIFSRRSGSGMLALETVVRIRREHASGQPMKAVARDLRLSRKGGQANAA